MSVVEAVERDLAKIALLDPELAVSTEAATALALAAEMDAGNSATSKSMCAGELAKQMALLRLRTPDVVRGDGVDELNARRAARLAGGADSSASACS